MSSAPRWALKRLRPGLVSFLIGLGALALLLAVAAARPPFLAAVDAAVFDQYQRWKPRETRPDTPVKIVLIDTDSLERIGQWPWPRTEIARLIDALGALGAAAIAFDSVFAEPDRTSPANMAEIWSRASPELARQLTAGGRMIDHDAYLAEAIARQPVVLGSFLNPFGAADARDTDKGAERPHPASVSFAGSDPRAALSHFRSREGNLPELEAAASGLGSVSLTTRVRGVVRTVPMLAAVGDRVIPSLSLEALRVAQGARGYLVRSTDASGESGGGRVGVESVRVGDVVAPLSRDGQLWVYFAERRISPPLSAWRLLIRDHAGRGVNPAVADATLRQEIEGRIVLIGASAPGLRDLISTPLKAEDVGVAVHAEIIEQLIYGDSLSRPDWAQAAELSLGALIGLLIALCFGLRLPLLATALTAIAVGGVAGVFWRAFAEFGLLLTPVIPLLAAVLPAAVAGSYNYLRSDRDRRAVRAQFEHFISPDVIDQIAADPERYLRPSGEERELTLLFCDVRGFTTLAEALSPEELLALLNDVLTPIADAVLEERGTIDKFMGDAVLAFWNAPRPAEDHVERALAAALRAEVAVAAMNTRLTEQGRSGVQVGVGLNSGVCIVGAMGSKRRLDYSCIGDPVNLASRLEGLTRAYGAAILVGSASASAAPDGRFALMEIDRVRVRGRTAPEAVFGLFGDAETAVSPGFQAFAAAYGRGLAAYRARDWSAAADAFAEAGAVEAGFNGGDRKALCALMKSRAEAFAAAPPPEDWDGVWVATSK